MSSAGSLASEFRSAPQLTVHMPGSDTRWGERREAEFSGEGFLEERAGGQGAELRPRGKWMAPTEEPRSKAGSSRHRGFDLRRWLR